MSKPQKVIIINKFPSPVDAVLLKVRKRFLFPTKYYVSFKVKYPATKESHRYGSLYGHYYDEIIPAQPEKIINQGIWVTSRDLIFGSKESQ